MSAGVLSHNAGLVDSASSGWRDRCPCERTVASGPMRAISSGTTVGRFGSGTTVGRAG